ncbi:MAG TPA: hypothetical protein VGK19_25955 [Capsulimonadaceae bacterium]|jgi:hypothetical protein
MISPTDYGFSPDATGVQNTRALQQALDIGGTVNVTQPGVYDVAGTVTIGGHTALRFGPGVFLRKVDEVGPFSHVILNKGALTKTYDEAITVQGLNVIVNGMDVREWQVFGLHGQVGFFYVKDLRIEGFRCYDLGKAQYGIHICTFEDIVVVDVIIKGMKDGVHLGRGKRFRISDCVFETFDDAIALNAHDYDVGNPELGWIEDGIVERCHDLTAENTTGFFCRILAGAWVDWRPGLEVQKSDTVVSDGRLYRVKADADGVAYTSVTQPRHTSGIEVLDGIAWAWVQDDVTYTAGVRNVAFRDIFLEKPRTAFSVHFDNDRYSRSFYPGADVPRQERISFDNIRISHAEALPFVAINTPIDLITVTNSYLGRNAIVFRGIDAIPEYGKTTINVNNCVFTTPGPFNFVTNAVPRKSIALKTTACLALHDDFAACVDAGPGSIDVTSDMPVIEL